MMGRLLDIDELQVFEALFDAGGATRAAERLGMTQSGVSSALARLRTRFDDELFVRASGGMRPTSRATELRPMVETVLDAARALANSTDAFDAATASRTFTIGSTDFATLVLMPHVAGAIELLAPGVDLRIVSYDKDAVEDLVVQGRLDVAVGVFPNPKERFVTTPVCDERFLGAARREHPLLPASGPMSLEAYVSARHALVTVRRDERGVIDEALRAEGRSRRVALTIPYAAPLAACLRTTDLLAALPSSLMSLASTRGLQSFELPVELGLEAWTLSMLWLPETRRDGGASWLRARLVDAGQALARSVQRSLDAPGSMGAIADE